MHLLKTTILVSLSLINISILSVQAIQWRGNWAMDCDFRGNDIGNARGPGEGCSGLCDRNRQCTHFAWNNFQGGTCWMKGGKVSKANALSKPGTVCGVSPKDTETVPTGGDSITFNTINKCSFPVWVGMQGRSKRSNWKLPHNGGWKLEPQQKKSVQVPKDFSAGRLWPRTGCRHVNGQFKCETGDCGPWIECAHDGVQRGGRPPVSLAEMTLENSRPDVIHHDYYDVSLVDGFNIKITLAPTNPTKRDNNKFWCTTPECKSDLLKTCPQVLKKFGSNGRVVACMSACEKFNNDQFCCRGAHNRPETCKAEHWPVNYPRFFKNACPMAYSYAYDDHSSTFFCKNTDYDIIFC